MTVGAVAGLASGYAVKKVGKLALFVVGIGFVGMQLARAASAAQAPPQPSQQPAAGAGGAAGAGATAVALPFRVPEPDYAAMEAALVRALDADGDGKVTVGDVQRRLDSFVGVLSKGLPSSSAFAVAFYLGLRWG